jgi:hypothetical protein
MVLTEWGQWVVAVVQAGRLLLLPEQILQLDDLRKRIWEIYNEWVRVVNATRIIVSPSPPTRADCSPHIPVIPSCHHGDSDPHGASAHRQASATTCRDPL